MGQSICSNTTQIQTTIQSNFLDFQYGEDQKQGKVQHTDNIKCKQHEQLEYIIENCTQKLRNSKLMYKDPTMPNDKIILKSIQKDNNQKSQIQAIFLRPYRFLNDAEKGRPYKIFLNEDSNQDYILVKDQVMQYFGVFLCFLANNPKIVQTLILTQSSSYGILAVKMNISGKSTIIYLDDYILCSESRPLFTQPIKNIYLWPCILEKAWLKTTGFTQKIIQKSTPEQVFQSFLDHPYKKISLEGLNQEQIKSYISKYLYIMNPQRAYILTTKKDPKIHIGISGRKYLYLIGMFLMDGKRYFYFRNPCGSFSFRGTYDQINQNMKTKIKQTFNCYVQEGNFVLDQSQFIQQISQFSICYFSKSMKCSSNALQLENNSQIYVLTQLKNKGDLSLCFRQQSNKRSEGKYSPLTFQIFNVATGQLISDPENHQACFGQHNSLHQCLILDLFSQVAKNLPASKYLIRLKKKDKKRHYFGIQSSLIACSATQVKFDYKNQVQFADMFKQCLKKQGKRNLQRQMKSKFGNKKGINPIQHVVFIVGDLICIYIEYVSTRTQDYKIEINFPSLKNLELIYPQINLKQTAVLPNILGPSNKQQIIVFQKEDLTAETELGYFQLQAF